jgi:hypothetical protein
VKRAHWLLLALFAMACAVPAACPAQAVCPWMNAATAGGFLGGDVDAAVTGVTPDGDATCDFKLGAASGSTLRIAVHTMAHTQQEFPGYLAQCASGAVALKGIGNEAVRCLAGSGASKGSELIIGRVRERVFVITIRAEWIGRPPTSPTKTRNPMSDDSENVAEQVAGSLF